jgi:hypothetical protein
LESKLPPALALEALKALIAWGGTGRHGPHVINRGDESDPKAVC